MPQVKMRYWAAAKDAAGVSEEIISAGTLDDALRAARFSYAGDVTVTAFG